MVGLEWVAVDFGYFEFFCWSELLLRLGSVARVARVGAVGVWLDICSAGPYGSCT